MEPTITPEHPDSPDATALIGELDAQLEPLYPRESRHGFSVQKLIADGKTHADLAERTSLYEKAQRIIREQALWLPLAHPTAFALTRANVEGYQVNPFGRQDFAKVRLD